MSITVSRDEVKGFEKWDDYIEWRAYIESVKDLESKMKNGKDKNSKWILG